MNKTKGCLIANFATVPAGAQSRRIIGTTVFSGMLVATMVGILFIPSLYVLFQRMREWAHRRG
nr:efflux RND transporter permease subunit [Klebsiella pneumoniae]